MSQNNTFTAPKDTKTAKLMIPKDCNAKKCKVQIDSTKVTEISITNSSDNVELLYSYGRYVVVVNGEKIADFRVTKMTEDEKALKELAKSYEKNDLYDETTVDVKTIPVKKAVENKVAKPTAKAVTEPTKTFVPKTTEPTKTTVPEPTKTFTPKTPRFAPKTVPEPAFTTKTVGPFDVKTPVKTAEPVPKPFEVPVSIVPNFIAIFGNSVVAVSQDNKASVIKAFNGVSGVIWSAIGTGMDIAVTDANKIVYKFTYDQKSKSFKESNFDMKAKEFYNSFTFELMKKDETAEFVVSLNGARYRPTI